MKRQRDHRVIALLILLGLPALAHAAAVGDWKARDHVPLEQFIVQAHRGAGAGAPENTIESFELGWKLNCQPEADVRTTSDGVIVAFHDNNFARVVVGVTPELAKKGVKDVTFDELQKLDVGNGQRVIRISDAFAAMKGRPERRMYLDVKQVDLDRLAHEVHAAGVGGQVTLASSRHAELRAWRALVPESQTLLWMGAKDDAGLERKFEQLRADDFADITQLQIHVHVKDAAAFKREAADQFVESDVFLVTRGDECRGRKILYQVLPYGGDTSSPAIYLKLLDLGFMSFATDHPRVTWEAVRTFYAERRAK